MYFSWTQKNGIVKKNFNINTICALANNLVWDDNRTRFLVL